MSSTLGLVITDGVGFRNFILSRFLEEATKEFDSVIILSCLPASVYKAHTNCRVIELAIFTEKYPTWFFRKAKEVAHLKLHAANNLGIQDNLKTNTSILKTTRGYGTRFIYKLTRFFHSEKGIQRFQSLQNKTFSTHKVTTSYQDILQKEEIDLLFFTHQRPPYIAPLVYAAQQQKIKTAAFIFSWDNLASKGRMASSFDYYLVWSALMKRDLLKYYSSITSESVAVVGTPQFEPYVMPEYKMKASEFYELFEIKSTLKTICFSCGDSSTSKNDELYIETIAEAIKNQMIPKVNFIVRTSPAEGRERFESLVVRYPFIKWHFPKWELTRIGHQESWSQRIPTVRDIKELRGLLEYSDININMLSTMSLDFMLFNKPVINTVFGTATNGLYDDQRFLGYEHIMHVVNSKATKVVTNANELVAAITVYLLEDQDAPFRTNLVEQQIGVALENTSSTVVKKLKLWL
ncbi:hypothetical protein ES677_02165 [Bizionia gelidisalsuginis]|uniref:Uncharacterized protein n=1 Tax=Bizionia gelidisalsuginis TaxID=291188 RepID=A0ABY3MDC3_9FLAO|nr:hypothetical protein [Bizionia gelidisalsuginis]TYC17005.1 hypothetical protein ES677_02165 [Bizionia gelidisalsuginis]